MAIEAAGFRDLHDMPVLGPLHSPRNGAVHGERAVTAPTMVMLEVAEEPPQVPLIEDDDVVQALVANAPDHPLDEGVLPGTPRGGEHFFDAEAFHARSEG